MNNQISNITKHVREVLEAQKLAGEIMKNLCDEIKELKSRVEFLEKRGSGRL